MEIFRSPICDVLDELLAVDVAVVLGVDLGVERVAERILMMFP